MFSGSLTDAQLAAIYGPMGGLPTLILLSGEEEYILEGSTPAYRRIGGRLAQVSVYSGSRGRSGQSGLPWKGVLEEDSLPACLALHCPAAC